MSRFRKESFTDEAISALSQGVSVDRVLELITERRSSGAIAAYYYWGPIGNPVSPLGRQFNEIQRRQGRKIGEQCKDCTIGYYIWDGKSLVCTNCAA